MAFEIKLLYKASVEETVEVAVKTFRQSHGTSASEKDIDRYISNYLTVDQFAKELNEEQNVFHLLMQDKAVIGYSKISLNSPQKNISSNRVTKLERLYILERFYHKGLGKLLLQHNIELAVQHKQEFIWLYVWTENEKAVQFYKRNAFKIIGSHDFQISETHTNPNHVMLKKL